MLFWSGFFVQSCRQLDFFEWLLELPMCLFTVPRYPLHLKKKERLKEMPLYFLEVLGGFNCAAACSVCSNPQTSCSKEFNHELVRMTWCMWCLKYLDILVSREEKQILWKTEAGELMSKDEWKVKASLIHGRRRELDHYHKGTTKLGSIGLMSNSIARRVKNYLNNIYIVIY